MAFARPVASSSNAAFVAAMTQSAPGVRRETSRPRRVDPDAASARSGHPRSMSNRIVAFVPAEQRLRPRVGEAARRTRLSRLASWSPSAHRPHGDIPAGARSEARGSGQMPDRRSWSSNRPDGLDPVDSRRVFTLRPMSRVVSRGIYFV